MRGVTVALPEPAREKLAEIELQRTQTEDAQRSCAADERERQARRSVPAAFDAPFPDQSMAHGAEAASGSRLEPAPAIDIKLKPGETLKAAIEAVREKIADVQLRELAQVRRAPLRKQTTPPRAKRNQENAGA